MGSKDRVISGPRNIAFDHYIEDVIAAGAWGKEQDYFGIEEPERAEYIRRKLVMAGRHMDDPVAVKAYWVPCTGCPNGGPGCRFHVKFEVYSMEAARRYKAAGQQRAARESR